MSRPTQEELLQNAQLIQDLAAVAKDAALLQGVLMRVQEAPNLSEVSSQNTPYYYM